MEEPTSSLLIMFIVIVAAPFIARRLMMPIIVLELIVGVILGMLGWIHEHPTLDFFASFGITYLMFLAGLEVDVEVIRKHARNTVAIAMASLLFPFAAGWMIGLIFGLNGLLLGTVFSTTSLGIVLPMTRELKGDDSWVQLLLSSVILIDIISMFLLAFVLSFLQGSLTASFAYSIVAVLTLFLIPWILNRNAVHRKVEEILSNRIYFEREVRFAFALIFLLGAVTESFGFHSILGSFVAGLIISEITPESSRLEEKLMGFGYGFFIPVFFIIVGTRVDLIGVFTELTNVTILAAVLMGGFGAKVLGVALATRLCGFSIRDSFAMGAFHSARLSLIIAVAEIARKANFIDSNIFSILVILAMVTSTVSPALGKYILSNQKIADPEEGNGG